MLIGYIAWGMKNRPVGGSSSETYCQPIDIIIIIIIIRAFY
jgi:hypothetical protein